MQNSFLQKKNKSILTVVLLTVLMSSNLFAQHEELKQKIAAFSTDKEVKFEKKYLNVTEPEYGELGTTNFEFHDFFMLKALEKTTNSIGNNTKIKLDYSFFGYENEEERNYALSFWFKNFMGARRITPGRDMRTYKGGTPTIVLINQTSICIVSLSCNDFDPEEFRELRKELLNYFGSPESMILELQCDGPLNWTKNPPDPKDPRWRM